MDQVKRGKRLITSRLACLPRRAAGCGQGGRRVLLIFGRRAGPFREQRGPLSRGFSPNRITTALAGIGGSPFILTAGGRLNRLIRAAMASLPGGVINAWLFLIMVTSQPGGLTGESPARSGAARRAPDIDRKSTRLNSSHLVIS